MINKPLTGKAALIFSRGGDTTSEIALKLAAEDCHVMVLGPSQVALQNLAHEVDDIGGECHYQVVDLTDSRTLMQASTKVFDDWGGAHYFIDDTGDPHNRLVQKLWPAYALMLASGGAIPRLEHAFVVSYALVVDDEMIDDMPLYHLSDQHFTLIQTAVRPSFSVKDAKRTTMPYRHSYSALVAREIVSRLIDPAYQDVYQVALQNEDQDIYARLYRKGVGGRADITDATHAYRRGRMLAVYVQSAEHGRGVFAAQSFVRGDLIFETNGKRMAHQTEHTLQIGWHEHLEPDSPIRLMNHSCEPNVGVKTNAQGIPDFYAFRDIANGDELIFDYGMTEYTHYPREDEALEFDLTCHCGAATCRGKLGYYSEFTPEIKEKYAGFVSDYLLTE